MGRAQRLRWVDGLERLIRSAVLPGGAHGSSSGHATNLDSRWLRPAGRRSRKPADPLASLKRRGCSCAIQPGGRPPRSSSPRDTKPLRRLSRAAQERAQEAERAKAALMKRRRAWANVSRGRPRRAASSVVNEGRIGPFADAVRPWPPRNEASDGVAALRSEPPRRGLRPSSSKPNRTVRGPLKRRMLKVKP